MQMPESPLVPIALGSVFIILIIALGVYGYLSGAWESPP